MVELVLEGEAADIILGATDAGGVKEALHPQNFSEQQQEVVAVRKLVEDLADGELLLALEALKHAIESPAHQGHVSFALQETDYEIDGLGLELRDEAIEEEDDEPTPIGVVFIMQKP